MRIFLSLLIILFLSSACNPLATTQIAENFNAGVKISSIHSTLTASASTVTSGDSVDLTLNLRDKNNRPFISNLAVITLVKSGGTSTGTLSAIRNNLDGTYSATFTGGSDGTALTVRAIVDGVVLTSTAPQIAVIPGFYSLLNSTVTLSASSVSSGSDVEAILTVRDVQGTQLTSGGLTVTFTSSGGGSSVSFGTVTDNNDGTYSVDVTGVAKGSATTIQGRISGNVVTSTLPTLTVSAGAPNSISILSGNTQTGTVGGALESSLTAVVKDANNNTVSGVTVNWLVTANNGTLGSSSSTSNTNGEVSSTFTLGTSAGANTVSATVDGTALSISFTATGSTGAPNAIAITSGNNQSGTAGSPLPVSLQVTVEDSYGNPVQGLTINWVVTNGSGSITAATTTNSSGVASNTWSLGIVAGSTNSVTATVSGYSGLTQTFSATATPGSPVAISITGGQSQSAFLGANLSTALSVNVKDSNNNNVQSATVNWSSTSGTLGSGASTSTNASGNSSNNLTLGTDSTAAGAKTVTATIDGTTTTVTFNVTASVAAPSVSGTNANASTVLSWGAVTGATSYAIYRSVTSGSGYSSVGTTSGTTFTNSSLTNGTNYYYVVRAVNNNVESANSSQVTVTPVVAPSAPRSLTGTLDSGSTVLSWTAPSTGTGPFTYKVYRSTTIGSGYSSIATTGSGVVTYTDTGLTNGTTYYYVVTALNGSSSGESSNSNEVAVIPEYASQLSYNFIKGSSFQSYNLLTYSQDFSHASWNKGNCSIQSNVTLAPDGTFTGSKLIDNTANAEHMASKSRTTTNESGTYSIYLKAAEYTKAQIQFSNMVNEAKVVKVNLSTCALISMSSAGTDYTNLQKSVYSVGKGWCRVSISATKGSVNSIHAVTVAPLNSSDISNFAGTGSSGIYLWGAQYELNPGTSAYAATTSSISYSFATPFTPDTGSTGLSFSRADTGASATLFGSDGKLRRAPHNYLSNSSNFSNFSYTNISSSNNLAPDGTNTAILNVFDQASGSRFFADMNANGASTYTVSVWAKAVSGSPGTTGRVYVKDKSSDVIQGDSGEITLSTTTWTRLTATGKTSSSGLRFEINDYPASAGSSNTILLWGPQVEENASASSYVKTTGSVLFNGARFDYDPLTLNPRGLLFEAQKTNNVTYSESIDNAIWTKNNSSVQSDVTLAPNGTMTADKLIEATSGTGSVNQWMVQSFAVTSGITYTISAYLKAAGLTTAALRFSVLALFSAETYVKFTLSGNGSIDATGAAAALNPTITALPNGWYRVSVSATPTSSGTSGLGIWLKGYDSHVGDGTSGIYVWGTQVEQGAFATSYIPTTSAAATRLKETATALTTSWYSQTAGTIFSKSQSYSPVSSGTDSVLGVMALNDGVGTNRIDIRHNQSAASRSNFNGAGGSQSISFGSYTTNTQYNFGLSFDTSLISWSRNGASTQTVSTNNSLPGSSATELQIGSFDARSYQVSGWIQNFFYHNSKLPDADLQRLSQ